MCSGGGECDSGASGAYSDGGGICGSEEEKEGERETSSSNTTIHRHGKR